MTNLLNNLSLLFQRIDWLDAVDILLVTAIFFVILQLANSTKAAMILRGVIILVIFLSILTTVVNLPALNWLIRTTLPALLLAIPVIFAPEIRRGLESLGRAGGIFRINSAIAGAALQETIHAVVTASTRLAAKNHGALIILQRMDNLRDTIQTGVAIQAQVTAELLLQIFYPNTPLHDGAVIIADNKVAAASCVLPLSASGILAGHPDHQMGLRHRAALGITENCDAIAVVVSEESGTIAVVHSGRMIRRLDAERLENLLTAFYRPERLSDTETGRFRRFFRTGQRPGSQK